jgi:glycosyltransferase involved in cell wall biosynthesis
MLMGLGKEVREADTVHVHGCWTFPVWWGGWLALRYKKTLVMSPRGALNPLYLQHSAWKKRLVGWMDRWLLRRASVVHATCGDEKRWVQAFLKVKSEKLKAKNINTNVEHSTLNIQHPRGEKPRIVVIPNGVEEVH